MTESPWFLLFIAFFVTLAWRAFGVVVAGRIDVEMPIFAWFGCVTRAMVCGLMVRAVFVAPTGLAASPLEDRAIAVAVAIGVFLLRKRNVLWGVLSGIGVFGALALCRSSGL